MKDKQLTGEEVRALRYFHHEKGDVSKYVGFEDACKKYPTLLWAWNTYQAGVMLLTCCIDNLKEEEEA